MNQQPKVDKIIQTINDAKVAHLSGLLADAKRLSDLLDAKKPDEIRAGMENANHLMIAPEGMTELEKAIVCVALYWFYRDVKEDGVCGNASVAVSPATDTKIETKLLFDNLDMHNRAKSAQDSELKGFKGVECPWGAIQLFWEVGKHRKIFGDDYNKQKVPVNDAEWFYKQLARDYSLSSLKYDQIYRGESIQAKLHMLKDALPCLGEGLLPWCAGFAGFVWVEALNILKGNYYINVAKDFNSLFNVLANSYGKVANKDKSGNLLPNGGLVNNLRVACYRY